MDTKTRVMDENSEDEGEYQLKAGGSASVVSAASKASKPTLLPVKKTLIREFNLHQKYDISNEVLYGQHLNKDEETVDVAQRSKHGNLGLFFASVCAILNNAPSYPSFNKSKAVQTTVKNFVETEIAYHIAR